MEAFEQQSNNHSYSSSVRKFGLLVSGLFGTAAISTLAICFPFVSPAFRKVCLPFVPATSQQIENILRALTARKGQLVDLGSGDGRIVIEAAKRGFVATGVELNIFLILYSRLIARLKGVNTVTTFRRQDLWTVDLSKFDNVVIFGVSEMMPILEKKLRTDLCTSRKDIAVIACRFPLLNLTPVRVIGTGIDTVWVYKFNNSA